MDYKKRDKAKSRAICRPTGHLRKTAEEAGWKRVGTAVQNTRYWLPETEMGKSAPHIYAKEYDSKRFMRWIATYLSAKYDISSEVQCYHEKSTCRILVAANENSDIDKLKSELHGMSLTAFFQKVSKEPIPIKFGRTTEIMRARQIRHGKNLQRLSDMAGESEKVTWSEYSFFVVPLIPGVSGLHAEQRIQHYLRGAAEGWRKKDLVDADVLTVDGRSGNLMLRPELLGGIKRPCFICTNACFTPDDRENVHPGMLWDTKCAGCILDQVAYEDTEEAIRRRQTVYKSLTEYGETEDVDSESEDDEDYYPRILEQLWTMSIPE